MKTCAECDGHGVVGDYGPFGDDFYGAKTCPACGGSGRERDRDARGRFVTLPPEVQSEVE